MCGITGVVGSIDPSARSAVSKMMDSMLHRGPDQYGIWTAEPSAGVLFGHRRLSILDLSESGRQPFVDRASGTAITYNGECYNYLELKSELEALGHDFASATDTEVILKAYIEWGEESFERLRGMYAFALWDPRTDIVYLVRDRSGIKPLYYAVLPDRLLFASELRSLLSTKLVKPELRGESLYSYLWHGFVPGPTTIIDGIQRVEAGTALVVSGAGRVRTAKHFAHSTVSELDEHEAVERCRNELKRSVSLQLASDVPLGIFLSGGVDSSVVAALAQRESTRNVITYNLRFSESEFDESSYARQVASRLGTDHRELTLTAEDFSSQLQYALAALDQPTFDGLNTYFISRAVKKAGITVALAGTGGDELFGGYESFRTLPWASRFTKVCRPFPTSCLRSAGRAVSTVLSDRKSEVGRQVGLGKSADILAAKGDIVRLYQTAYGLFSSDFLATLFVGDNVSTTEWGLNADRLAKLEKLVVNLSALESVSALELASFLGERLLPDTDSAAMAVTLETRVPLVDHVFIDAVAALPAHVRYHPIGRKRFLRSMISDTVPDVFFDRPKAGFVLPIERWSRRGLAEALNEVFSDVVLAESIGLNPEAVARLWRSYKSGARGLYWSRVWSLFVLLTWCRKNRAYLAR